MTLENIYNILMSFGELFDIIGEDDKKRLFSYLIKEIQLYRLEENQGLPLKSIEFNFPIYIDNQETRKLLWGKNSSVETLVVLRKKY